MEIEYTTSKPVEKGVKERGKKSKLTQERLKQGKKTTKTII